MHLSSAADAGGSWLYLVIPVLCVSAREAEDVQGLWETLFWSLWVEILCPEGTSI